MSAQTKQDAAGFGLAAAGSGLATSIGAVVLAMLCGGALIALWGGNPLAAYGALLQGAFGSLNGLSETLLRAIPLICTGLAVALAFRAGTFNLGAEGQLLFGGTAAAVVGLQFTHLPAPLLIAFMMLAAMIAGALWSLLPGVLKLKFGASELITTIMLNYIAVHFISFLLYGPLQESAGYLAQTDRLSRDSALPRLITGTRLHIGLLVVLLAALAAHIALWHTVWGYRLRVAGLSARVAQNSGMNVTKLTLTAFLISGALAGLAGYMEVAGVQRRMIEGLSPGYGYTGIIVALLGGTSPLGVVIAALLFAALQVGATAMETQQGVPSTLVTIIQGLVVLFVIGRSVIGLIAKRGQK